MTGIDLQAAIRDSKSAEGVLGWSGFRPQGNPEVPLEGVLKLSAHQRSDASGYLTLTFFLEAPPERDFGRPLIRLPEESILKEGLGAAFEMAVHLRLDDALKAGAVGSALEEVDLYFRWLETPVGPFLEETVLPSFEKWLAVTFDPMQPAKDPRTPSPKTPVSWWRRWFGA